jgi:hypothetical protein
MVAALSYLVLAVVLLASTELTVGLLSSSRIPPINIFKSTVSFSDIKVQDESMRYKPLKKPSAVYVKLWATTDTSSDLPGGISPTIYSVSNKQDDVFGAEFKTVSPTAPTEEIFFRKNKIVKRKIITPEMRQRVMKGYDSLRITFILDSVFISIMGLCLVWQFGTLKDAYSYGIGAGLGLGYATLLSRYVESIGSDGGGSGGGGGSARFAPVLLLVLLYGKNREVISIIPELLGFFGYQLGSLLQIFNDNAYGDDEEEIVEDRS